MVTLFNLLPIIGTLFFSVLLTRLSYLIPKRLGHPKAAKVLSILVGLFCAIFTLALVFDDELFSRDDAREILTTMEISLSDNFEIVHNKSFIGPDIFHTFVLKVSSRDRKKIIEQIISSTNFQSQTEISKIVHTKEGEREVIRIKNYETETSYVTEYVYQHRNSSTSRKIAVDKKVDQLTLEEWL